MSGQTALELAGEIGYERYGDIGKSAFEELELCFASRIAPRFESSLRLRSYINLNFYWARGYFKNTIIEEFQECLPADFSNRKVTSATIQTMFGSINDAGTKLVPPLFWGYELCFMPELLAFLAASEFKDKVNVFNEVLEGKETTRDLLKFGKAQQSLIDEYVGGKNGLYFDGRTLSYEPDVCFVVGTRPIENQIYTYLEQSGFWSRFHSIQFRITDSTARNIFTGAMTKNDVDVETLKKQLKAFNESLLAKRDTLSGDIPDYDKLLLPILQKADEIGGKMCEKTPGLDLSAVLNVRIKGDITREVRACRILYPDSSDEELQKWIFGRLPHFFDFVANPIIAPSITVAKTRTIDACLQEVLRLTKGQPKHRDEILEAMQKQDYSRPMVDRVLKAVNERKLNKSTEYGVYET